MNKRTIVNVDTDSKLKAAVVEENPFFSTTLRHIPRAYKKRFNEMKEKGEVTGTFNSYFVQALGEKLKRDAE